MRTTQFNASRGNAFATRLPTKSKISRLCAAVAFVVAWPLISATAGRATVTISSAPTQNMSCSDGVCAPTAAKAILNVADLETMLASGNTDVTTTGSGVQANDILVHAPLSWSSTSALALDAYHSIRIEKPVSVAGLAALSITTNDGGKDGYFSFGAKGNVTFANLSSTLTINDAAYTLVGDIKSLAAAIASNSAGNYALANSYDAGPDGTYQNSPIPTEFSGNFEGLGNTISNLSLNGTGDYNQPVGLFSELANGKQLGGAIENVGLRNLRAAGSGSDVGGLVGINGGSISGSFVLGSANSEFSGGVYMGLLTGVNGGQIVRSYVVGQVTTSEPGAIGGLSGSGGSTIESFASAKVSGGRTSVLGGLAAGSDGPISQSYATGTVSDTSGSDVGGLIGENLSTISQSYSTTALRHVGRRNPDAGGLIGVDQAPAGSITSSYWDTSTSHVRGLKHGAGTPKNDPGITGLTTEQLQSGLPAGFDPKVWAENPKINNGLPYLIDNPPQN